MSPDRPGACDERYVRFGDDGHLVGVLAEPAHPTDRPPLVVLGAGLLHRSGPSRAVVALARVLASRGHLVLRFDLSGIGDSPVDGRRPLRDAVLADIRAAVDEVTAGRAHSDAVLVGFCSGADNAFAYAADDPRIGGLVLFDPIVHSTAAHHRRVWWRRLTSASAWRTLVTGRWWRRPPAAPANDTPPPEYFSMLVAPPDEADQLAARQAARGVRRLHLLSSGVHEYCSAPSQVREAWPSGYRDATDVVVWAPHIDHVLSRPDQIDWLVETVSQWLSLSAAHRVSRQERG
ncbi:MAG: alpha/beta hydrolase [Gemmatimonadaceae bacterium]|nr:alpha/beta hydrolase [Gemmatimonadaceae bacterium]